VNGGTELKKGKGGTTDLLVLNARKVRRLEGDVVGLFEVSGNRGFDVVGVLELDGVGANVGEADDRKGLVRVSARPDRHRKRQEKDQCVLLQGVHVERMKENGPVGDRELGAFEDLLELHDLVRVELSQRTRRPTSSPEPASTAASATTHASPTASRSSSSSKAEDSLGDVDHRPLLDEGGVGGVEVDGRVASIGRSKRLEESLADDGSLRKGNSVLLHTK
jgi:hypothetical protein